MRDCDSPAALELAYGSPRPEAGFQQGRGAGVALLERNFCAIVILRQRLNWLMVRFAQKLGSNKFVLQQ